MIKYILDQLGTMILKITDRFYFAIFENCWNYRTEYLTTRIVYFWSFLAKKRSQSSNGLIIEILILKFLESVVLNHFEQTLIGKNHHRPRVSTLKSIQIKSKVMQANLFLGVFLDLFNFWNTKIRLFFKLVYQRLMINRGIDYPRAWLFCMGLFCVFLIWLVILLLSCKLG